MTPREQVLLVVSAIPQGRFSTYGRVAAAAGLPRQARYVGTLLGKLPDGSAIPWHRVMNAQRRSSFPESDPRYSMQIDALAREGVVMSGASFPKSQLWPDQD